jgi:predicted ATPase
VEQLWVWLDYLDLNAYREGKSSSNLPESLGLLRQFLGPERAVSVKEGRLRVATQWSEQDGRRGEVLLDQLPSGEQQCVLLLGEIARRRRKGAVLFIDEPEISLHSAMQRHLASQLRRIAGPLDMQVFLATHSPEVVRSVLPRDILSLDHLDRGFLGAGDPGEAEE